MTPTSKLILYHARCFDGLGAAWCARRHPDWRDAEIVPVNYSDDEHPDVVDREVLIVDFSYPREVLSRMHEQARSLHVYDHHATAEEALRGLDFCTFDMNRSGAGLVWDELIGGPRPMAIDYIEDRDLWRHALPNAAEVQAWMRSFQTTYETIEMLIDELPDELPGGARVPRHSVVRAGMALLGYRRLIIETAAEDAMEVTFSGYRGRAVNFGLNELYSEVAEKIGEGADFGLAYMFKGDGRVYMSFRSKDAVDVGRIAKLLGGGGHKHAAGALSSRDEFMLAVFDNGNFDLGSFNAMMDANENAPFASVGHMVNGRPPPLSTWIHPSYVAESAWPAYRFGYLCQTRLTSGPDWESATWGWTTTTTA